VDALAMLSSARAGSKICGKLQLSKYDDDAMIEQTFRVETTRRYSILVWRDSGEEAVLEIQGMLEECLLPPMTRHIK